MKKAGTGAKAGVGGQDARNAASWDGRWAAGA